MISVYVKGIFNGCRAVLPYMLDQGYGRIVNIAGKEGNAGMLAYSVFKAAVIKLAKVVGKEYATHGITCNAVALAVIRTKMVADMPKEQVGCSVGGIYCERRGRVHHWFSGACRIIISLL